MDSLDIASDSVCERNASSFGRKFALSKQSAAKKTFQTQGT